MKNKYTFLTVVFLFIMVTYANAQKEFHLSQYMLHQPFTNPAAMSSYNNINGALLYKKQWVGLEGAPQIQAFNFNLPFKQYSNNHAGLTVVNDKIGVNNNLYISASYAYAINISRTQRISLGLSAIADVKQSNLADVQDLYDLNDVVFSRNSQTHFSPNFQYGMYYYGKKFYVGLVIPKLLNNAIDVDNQTDKVQTNFNVKEWHYYLSGGYKFDLSENATLTTSTQLKQVTGTPLQIDINALIEYNQKIGMGLAYRTSKELVALLSYQLTPMFKLAYSYDYSFSQLSAYQSGTHEISLVFNLKNNKKNLFITAPRF